MSQYEIVGSDILLELLEVAFNNILYLRKFYPAEVFVEKKVYSTLTHVSQHPQLTEYLENVLKSIRQWIIADRTSIETINLVFINNDKKIIEKYVFNFLNNQDYGGLQRDPYFVETEQNLRNLCLKLSMATSYLKPLPEETTFSINIETRKSTLLSMSESSMSQQFPWILNQETIDPITHEENPNDKNLLPLAIIESLAVEIYVVEINK